MSLDRYGETYQPYLLSLFRFITGLLLFQYGVAKIFKIPVVAYFANPPPLIMTAGAIELVLGGLLMIGLLTRLSAFILSGEMAFAYFLGHLFKTGAPVLHPLNNGGTAAILFCFACLYLAAAGGGPISVDAVIGARERRGLRGWASAVRLSKSSAHDPEKCAAVFRKDHAQTRI
jgi:putative oxidoreductase